MELRIKIDIDSIITPPSRETLKEINATLIELFTKGYGIPHDVLSVSSTLE